MPNCKAVIEHRKSVHNIKRTRPLRMKDINIEPNIHDHNFHCKSCKVDYSGRDAYKRHLRFVHFMVLKTTRSLKIMSTTTLPDPDNPNLYCRVCGHTYAAKWSYHSHCQYVHGVTPSKRAKQISAPGSMTDTYCRPCDVHLASKQSYKKHLFTIHNVDWRTTQQKQKNIVPDVDDPNFYFRVCEKDIGKKIHF